MKRVRPSCEADRDRIESFSFVPAECLNRVICFALSFSLLNSVPNKNCFQPLIEMLGYIKGDTQKHTHKCTPTYKKHAAQHTFSPSHTCTACRYEKCITAAVRLTSFIPPPPVLSLTCYNPLSVLIFLNIHIF